MLLATLELLLMLPLGVVVLTIFEDPKWIVQGIARLLRPDRKTRLHCKHGRCR